MSPVAPRRAPQAPPPPPVTAAGGVRRPAFHMPANDNRSPLRPFVMGALVAIAVAALVLLVTAI